MVHIWGCEHYDWKDMNSTTTSFTTIILNGSLSVIAASTSVYTRGECVWATSSRRAKQQYTIVAWRLEQVGGSTIASLIRIEAVGNLGVRTQTTSSSDSESGDQWSRESTEMHRSCQLCAMRRYLLTLGVISINKAEVWAPVKYFAAYASFMEKRSEINVVKFWRAMLGAWVTINRNDLVGRPEALSRSLSIYTACWNPRLSRTTTLGVINLVIPTDLGASMRTIST